jgi:ABC-type transport system substrate-binding protein
VLANVRRWTSVPEGRRLLPTLFNADAPRPDLVRLLLVGPTPDLPRQLSSPRLGLVSPASLRPQSGEGARLSGARAPGTGPFEIERFGDSPLNLGRNASWWGTPLGLGPALDAVEFDAVADEPARIAALRGGEAEVVSDLSPSSLASIRSDPLLTVRPGGLGLQRSVRGIESAQPIPFSGVWLTNIGP